MLPKVSNTREFLGQIRTLAILVIAIMVIGALSAIAFLHMTPTGAAVLTVSTLVGSGKGGDHTADPTLGTWGLVMKFFGAIIIWFAMWTTIGLVVEGKFGDYFKEVREMKHIRALRGHYIVCGAGRVGKPIGNRLKKAGEEVVFVEKNKDVIAKLKEEGYYVIEAETLDEATLTKAGIENAQGIAVAVGDDGQNLLAVLTAKELNDSTKIAARVSDSKLIPKFKRAGANYIILPEAMGGTKLADALRGYVDEDHIFTNES
ncbi:MAG: NAD-binding protein [DPANN group archaeon]|nr:NAD-binding protein [DPANN group archaeon]